MSMSKTTVAIALAMGLGLAATGGGASLAEQGKTAPATSPNTGSANERSMQPHSTTGPASGMAADEIIGRDVVNRQGEKLGTIEGLVIQPQQEKIHAVISVGGFLGMGDYDVLVPMKDLKVGQDNFTLTSQDSKAELKALPEYDEKEWWEINLGPSTRSTEPVRSESGR